MKIGYRELRVGSVISAVISIPVALYSGVEFISKMTVWSALATEQKLLWSLGLLVGVALLVSSILYTATEIKWIGVSHGLLMTFVALVIFSYASHGIYDEMAAIPVYGGMILFAIVAAGSAALTLIYATDKKPNQAPKPTAPSGRGSS